MSSYLKNLFSATENAKEGTDEAVEAINKLKMKIAWGTKNPDLGLLSRGELVLFHFQDEVITEELKLRFDIFLTTLGQAIVSKIKETIRQQFGDLQSNWLGNEEGVVEAFSSFYKDLIFGDKRSLVPSGYDVDESDFEFDLKDDWVLTRHPYVEIMFFFSVPTQVSDDVVLRSETPSWGEFKAAIGKWEKSSVLGIRSRKVMFEWPEPETEIEG